MSSKPLTLGDKQFSPSTAERRAPPFLKSSCPNSQHRTVFPADPHASQSLPPRLRPVPAGRELLVAASPSCTDWVSKLGALALSSVCVRNVQSITHSHSHVVPRGLVNEFFQRRDLITVLPLNKSVFEL